MSNYKLQLDIHFEPGQELQALADMINSHNVQITKITPWGPAGGNPCIEFTGPKANLTKLAIEHFDSESNQSELTWIESQVTTI